MRDDAKTPRVDAPKVDEPKLDVDTLIPTYLTESDNTPGARRTAIVLAVLFHIVLLAVSIPESTTEAVEPEKPKVYVVEPIRFKPPEIEPATPPQPRERRVPIPDPDPDAPEPILNDVEFETRLDLPPIDPIISFPDAPPEPEITTPMEITGGIVAPVKVFHPNPAYTEVARRARIEGVVIVEAIVDAEGNVVDAKIIKPLPMGLDASTLETVVRWKFDPATLRGKPVPVIYRFSVTFSLN